MKLMVIPVGRSLVFSGSQAKNISYSIDHRQKIFRTLSITGKKYVFYRKDISVSTSWWEVANAWFFFGSQVKNISYPTDHRQKIFRTLPITGNKIFVLYRKWWEVANHI